MAIAFDTATSGSTSATTITTSHTMGAGSGGIIFHLIHCRNNASLSSHTYNGVSSTEMTSFTINSFSSDRNCYIRYSLSPATGAANSVTTFDTNTEGACHNLSYTGASQSGIPDANQAAGTGNSGTAEITTGGPSSVADNSWKIFWLLVNSGTLSDGANGTLRTSSTGGVPSAVADSAAAITPPGNSTIGIQLTVGGSVNYVQKAFTFAPEQTTSIKTFNGLANASTKTVNGLARASVKTYNGLA